MEEREVKNISDVPELKEAGWAENATEPISVAEDKYITIYGASEIEGQYGLYVVMECQINGGHGRTRLRTGAQAIVRKMMIARSLDLWPIRGRVVRIGRTWDIV